MDAGIPYHRPTQAERDAARGRLRWARLDKQLAEFFQRYNADRKVRNA